MNMENMKNVIVLKDIPSNIVEEAIVILKENINIKNIDKKKENVKVTAYGKINSKDFVVKEAESVVANYISSMEKPKQLEVTNKKLKKKYERIKKWTAFFAIVSVLGIIINLI